MSLAVVLPFWFDRPPLEALDVARAADTLGYRELWVGEMLTFDAFALAGAIARETSSITLVIGPLAVGVRDPAALALGIASVALLGGRPAHLALGASTPTVVGQWHGLPWRRTVTHVRETVAALRQILAGERSDFRGMLARSAGFRLAAGPCPAEICVAAFAPRMMELAATVADRVVLNLLTPRLVAQIRRRIDAIARAAGRRPPPLTVWVPAALDPGPTAIAQMVRQLVAYVGARGYAEMFAAAGFGAIVDLARGGAHPRDVLSAIPPQLLAAVGAIGNTREVRARIDEYAAAGADVVALVPVTADDPGGARLLSALA
jgi:probable F420-dependent oxidoreductase